MEREFNFGKLIAWLVGGLIAGAIVLSLNPFVQIKTGQVGVVLNWGAFNGQIMEQGLHWRTPLVQQVVKMSTQTEKLEVQSEAYSKDLQVIVVDSVLNYSLAPESAGEVYKTLRLDYENKVISPRVEAAVKQTIAQYTAEELPGKRPEVTSKIQEVLKAIVAILAANKVAVDTLATETKQVADQMLEKASATLSNQTQTNIKEVLKSLGDEYNRYLASLRANSAITKSEIEKSIKAQNDRAFTRLQALVDNIELPKNGMDGRHGMDGMPGKDGSPDEPEEIVTKLESLEGNDRLDVSAIKGLADYFKIAKKAGKQMLVGGIRFFENLADVSIVTTKKRQDLLAQYKTTNNRWENGIALTVSATEPTSPEEKDVWIDVS